MVSNVIHAEKIALFVGRDSRQGETGNSRTMVRAGIAASACKPMRALQAYPASMRDWGAIRRDAACGLCRPTLHMTPESTERLTQNFRKEHR